MTCDGSARRGAFLFLLGLMLSGCVPAGDDQLDEKKEPHFISGKNLLQQMDYQGAIDAFEKATEANPRSASAHFELGLLYEQKASDPAAAIYHYDRYLKYGVHPDNADIVRQHINFCKLELAKSVAATGPLGPGAQREMERLTFENKDLQARVAALQTQLDQARAAGIRPPASAPIAIPATNPTPPRVTIDSRRVETPRAPPVVAAPRPAPPPATSPRTHTVRKGEYPLTIARQYGITVKALLAANPQVQANHLPVGQTLNIPAP